MRVAATGVEEALARMLDAFPDGVTEEVEGDEVVLAGYLPAGRTPAVDAVPEPVEPGWREAWRAFHRPVVVGPFWVGPPWLPPDPGREAIVIEPGLAFGTGAHGSTRAALELLVRDPEPRGSLLDIGCGSGVLAIAAARLGHGPVSALDRDPHAVRGDDRERARQRRRGDRLGGGRARRRAPVGCRCSSRTSSSSCSSRCSRAASPGRA